MPCLQWTIGGGGIAVPQLQARRIWRPAGAVGHARAGLRQWGGKMEWNGTEKSRTGKGAEGDSVKAAASMSSGYVIVIFFILFAEGFVMCGA